MKRTLFGILLLALVLPACQHRFGKKVEKAGKKVYFLAPLKTADAEKTLVFLEESSFNFGAPVIPLQISAPNDTIVFKMEVQMPGAEEEESTVFYLRYLAQRMSEKVFEGKPVNVHLCNSDLETLKVVPFSQVIR